MSGRDPEALSCYWPHEKKQRKPWLVVSVQEDLDLDYDHFDTQDEARSFVDVLDRKACIVGPESVEDHT
jgi:hypothetical protein